MSSNAQVALASLLLTGLAFTGCAHTHTLAPGPEARPLQLHGDPAPELEAVLRDGRSLWVSGARVVGDSIEWVPMGLVERQRFALVDVEQLRRREPAAGIARSMGRGALIGGGGMAVLGLVAGSGNPFVGAPIIALIGGVIGGGVGAGAGLVFGLFRGHEDRYVPSRPEATQ